MIMVLTSYQSCSDRKRKDGGVYTTRADYRSWAHWGLGVRLIDKSLGFPQLLHSRWQQMFRGWLLTQCAWGPEVSLPARGRQDVAALRSGRSREIYWSRGSTFWPETSGKRAEPTKCSSGICSTPWERLVRLPLETFFFLIGNQCLAFVCNQWRQKVKSNMCAPVSSAGCERVVGCQSRIKIDWRSSLKGEAMQQLMLVSLEGPTSQDISAEGPTERTNKQATSDLLDS